MELKQRIENNKLIAEFMHPEMLERERIEREGLEISDNMSSKLMLYTNDYELMRYHDSWDWLMPVIDRINKVVPKDGLPKESTGWYAYYGLESVLALVDREAVLRHVLDFINWYNEWKDGKKQDVTKVLECRQKEICSWCGSSGVVSSKKGKRCSNCNKGW